MRRSYLIALAPAALAAAPSYAYAAADSAVSEPFGWIISLIALIASIVLLLSALGLARVSQGSAIAENISYVIAACVCLAGSVLAGWAEQWVTDGMSIAQIDLAGKALTVVSITFFCTFFLRVRGAMRRFLVAMSGASVPAPAAVSEPAVAGGAPAGASVSGESAKGERADG
jgi:hypothetical protein